MRFRVFLSCCWLPVPVKPAPLMTFLNQLVDPRKRANSRNHNFADILVVAIGAIICGADTWEEMKECGEEKEDWLRTLLELSHGILRTTPYYRIFVCSIRISFKNPSAAAFGYQW